MRREIISGALRERYEDGEVWMRSLNDLFRIYAFATSEVYGTSPARRLFVAHDRGLT